MESGLRGKDMLYKDVALLTHIRKVKRDFEEDIRIMRFNEEIFKL